MKKILTLGLLLLVAITINAQRTAKGFSFLKQTNSSKNIDVTVTSITNYIAGTTMDLYFNVYFQSEDFEYGDSVSFVFPVGMTPIAAIDPFANVTEGQDPEALNPISGQVVSWGDNDNYYGGIELGEHIIWVKVQIDASLTGDQNIQWFFSGDEYAGTIHQASGTVVVQEAQGADITFNVKDQTNAPIEGASVKVYNSSNDLVYDLLTNAQGSVNQFIEEGSYTYTVSNFGYSDVNGNLTVINGQPQTIEVILTSLSTYNVTFTIKNILNTPLVGANIEILQNNIVVIQGQTDNQGTYIAQNLPTGTYTYNVYYFGYTPILNAPMEIVDQDLEAEIQLEEIILPVQNLQAQINNKNVTLTWVTPTWGPTGTKHWDDGQNFTGIGTNSPVVFAVAHRYEPSDISEFTVNTFIDKISFFPKYANATYTVKIWQGTDVNTLVEVYSETVADIIVDSWNDFVLSNVYYVDKTKELWVGYEINTQGGYPAGCDATLEHPGKGNMIYFNGAWSALTDLNSSLTNEWNISFHYTAIDYFDGSYNVYLNGVQNNETPIFDETYTLENLPEGDYIIGVTALFETAESDTQFVNITIQAINQKDIKATFSPNPTKGILNISTDAIYNIVITDISGKVVDTKQMNTTSTSIDMSKFAEGVYFVRLSNTETSKVVKVIKQ